MQMTRTTLLAWLLCLAPPCAFADPPDPPWPTEAWTVSTPEDQGMASGIPRPPRGHRRNHQPDSLLIVRHGDIVTEAYYAPYQAGIRHDLRSITKSIIGTLTAIEVRSAFGQCRSSGRRSTSPTRNSEP